MSHSRSHAPTRALAFALVVGLGISGFASAQPVGPEQALERLFTADTVSEEWFAPQFLDQIPVAQIEAIVEQTTEGIGAFQEVVPEGDRYRIAVLAALVNRIEKTIVGAVEPRRRSFPRAVDQSA